MGDTPCSGLAVSVLLAVSMHPSLSLVSQMEPSVWLRVRRARGFFACVLVASAGRLRGFGAVAGVTASAFTVSFFSSPEPRPDDSRFKHCDWRLRCGGHSPEAGLSLEA